MKLKFFVEGRNQLYIYRVEGTLEKKTIKQKNTQGNTKTKRGRV